MLQIFVHRRENNSSCLSPRLHANVRIHD